MESINNKLETPFVDFEIIDGILQLTYKEKITLEVAKKVVENRMAFTNGKSYPILVLGIKVAIFDKEARDYLSEGDGIKGVNAGAIVGDSVFHSYLGNFFLKVSKPKIPARLFTDKSAAIQWLKNFR